MKIIQLKIANFEKITAFDITPTDNVIELTGANGAGKSSVLHAIAALLNGGKDIPADPIIKKGKKQASVKIDLGDYTAKLTINQKSNSLQITRKDGKTIKNTRATLNEIIGARTLDDPMQLMNEPDAKKQRQMFLDVLGVDVSDIEEKYQAIYDSRRDVGVQLKQVQGEFEPLIFDNAVGLEETKISDVMDEFTNACDNNQEIKDAEEMLANYKQTYKDNKTRLTDLQAVNEQLKSDGMKLQGELKTMNKIDTEAIQIRLDTIEEINTQIRTNQQYQTLESQIKDLSATIAKDTESLKILDTDKQTRLSSAKLSTPGITITSEQVLYNDIPISKASSGEKIKLGFSFIAAAHPNFRVLRIEDGDKPDEETMQIIRNIAQEKDVQVWLEKVDSTGNVGIYIENGQIKQIN